jgi:DNA replication initiation complex subunit (GINS family)
MSLDELTLRDLRVQALAERRDGRLVKLPAHFHERLARLEHGLEKARDAAREDEQRFQRANGDISKLSDLKLELHKHRERKLTRLAREKVNGQQPSLHAVTEQEREFLESVASVIGQHRQKLLVRRTAPEPAAPVAKPEPKAKPAPKPAVPEPEPAAAAPVDIDDSEALLVRVLEDLPTFTGLDARNYSLKANDVAHIPLYNARMLLEAGKVERLEGEA